MFNKEEYWARRNNKFKVTNKEGEIVAVVDKPLRGQKNLIPDPVLIKESGITMVLSIKGSFPANRRMRRKRTIDRTYSKKGFAYGRRIGSKKFNIHQHWQKKMGNEENNES